MFGKELILDLYFCDSATFTRESIEGYFKDLCELIEMNPEDLHFWDYEGCSQEEKDAAPTHLAGTSAIQFITTSNITIHTLEILKEVYVNVFSCKDFDYHKAKWFSQRWFGAEIAREKIIVRGAFSELGQDEIVECSNCIYNMKCSGPGWDRRDCTDPKRRKVDKE
jgi:S-adenosylmethionine/arginine decarboxylase-like enzyme